MDGALANGVFSQDEARALKRALTEDPSLRAPVADHLRAALARSDRPITITDAALEDVSRALDADFKELFFAVRSASGTVTHDVTLGLTRQAPTVADAHSPEKNRAASDTRLRSQRAILDGKAGVVDRPIGGSKGAAYDAAQALASHVASQAEATLDARLSVEAKAAKDVLRQPFVRTGQQVMAEAMKNPDTMKALSDVATLVGKPGFTEALSTAASSVGRHIVDATSLTAVNAEAVQAAVQGVASGADKLVKASGLFKNPAIEAAVAKHASRAAQGAAQLGAKLTQGAAASASATATATASATAAAAQATSAAAGADTGAAAGTAQAAGAAAKTGTQALPAVGQALGVVTTGMAACEFVGSCRHSPRDWQRIAAAGLNVVGQAAGIVVPFVGAASTGLKLAADAAMSARDKKLGKEPPQGLQLADASPHVGQASALASTFLGGAGHGVAASKIRAYAEQVDVLAQTGLSSTELASLPVAQRDALLQSLAACAGEADALAQEAKGTPTRLPRSCSVRPSAGSSPRGASRRTWSAPRTPRRRARSSAARRWRPRRRRPQPTPSSRLASLAPLAPLAPR